MLYISTGLRNKLLGLKSELLTNGSFTSDTTDWTATTATLTSAAGGQSGNCLQIANSSGTGSARQSFTAIKNHVYRLIVYFKKGSAASGGIIINNNVDPAAGTIYYSRTGLTDAGWTKYEIIVPITCTPNSETCYVHFQNGDGTGTNTSLFDEVSLEDIARAFKDVFATGLLTIFAGTMPTNANNNIAAFTDLVTLSVSGGGGGVTFEESASGIITKETTETWQGTVNPGGGTASFWVLYQPDDALALSTTRPRIMGACGPGSEMTMASTDLVEATTHTLNTFQLTLPAS